VLTIVEIWRSSNATTENRGGVEGKGKKQQKEVSEKSNTKNGKRLASRQEMRKNGSEIVDWTKWEGDGDLLGEIFLFLSESSLAESKIAVHGGF